MHPIGRSVAVEEERAETQHSPANGDQRAPASASKHSAGPKEANKHGQLSQFLTREQTLETIHIAAHDLRSPLYGLTKLLQMFAAKYHSSVDEDGEKLLRLMNNSANEIRRTIDDLLAYALVLAAEPVTDVACDANAALDGALKKLGRQIEECNAETLHSSLPTVSMSKSDLSLIFEHLLSNALRFRQADVKPLIQVAVVRDGDEYRFQISDNGEGVDPEYHDLIFEPFKKLHPPGISGTGLGLAVCRILVERHGGCIWVNSGRTGTDVFFTVPATGIR